MVETSEKGSSRQQRRLDDASDGASLAKRDTEDVAKTAENLGPEVTTSSTQRIEEAGQGVRDLGSEKHRSNADKKMASVGVTGSTTSDKRTLLSNWWSFLKSLWLSNESAPSADDGEGTLGGERLEEGQEEEGEEGEEGEDEYAGDEEEGGNEEGEEAGEDEEGEWDADALGGISAEELAGLWRAGDNAEEGGEWEREGEGGGEAELEAEREGREGEGWEPEWSTRWEGERGVGGDGWELSEEAEEAAEAAEAEAEGVAGREGSGEPREGRSVVEDGPGEADVTATSEAQTPWTSEFEVDLSLKGPQRMSARSLIATGGVTPIARSSGGKTTVVPTSVGKRTQPQRRRRRGGARFGFAKKLRKQFRSRFKRGSLQLLNLIWNIAIKVNNTKQFGSLRTILTAVITKGVIVAAEALGLGIPEGRAFIATLVIVARSNATAGDASSAAGIAAGNSTLSPATFIYDVAFIPTNNTTNRTVPAPPPPCASPPVPVPPPLSPPSNPSPGELSPPNLPLPRANVSLHSANSPLFPRKFPCSPPQLPLPNSPHQQLVRITTVTATTTEPTQPCHTNSRLGFRASPSSGGGFHQHRFPVRFALAPSLQQQQQQQQQQYPIRTTQATACHHISLPLPNFKVTCSLGRRWRFGSRFGAGHQLRVSFLHPVLLLWPIRLDALHSPQTPPAPLPPRQDNSL
ncbi:hypothetical protein CLOM_g3689 [Closterium sp. NIES-68]|nr:hypothetical protein CLOM_g3689 [Closterium sp. NIES-68]